MQSTITIFLENGSYQARFIGPKAEEIEDLFGTNVIPLPYTDKADADQLLATIKKLNPMDDVKLI